MPFDGAEGFGRGSGSGPVLLVRIGDNNGNGKDANGVLLSREHRLVATTTGGLDAYRKASTGDFAVFVPAAGEYVAARVAHIAWNCGLAFLQIQGNAPLPVEASVSTTYPHEFDPVIVKGFGANGEFLKFTDRIYLNRSNYGVTLPSLIEQCAAENNGSLPNEDKRKIYRSYLRLLALNRDPALISGSSVLDLQEAVVGLVSISMPIILCIPAFELANNLLKAVAAIKNPEYDPDTGLGRRPWWNYRPGAVPQG